MRVLKIIPAGVTLADQDTPFLPGQTVVATAEKNGDVLEGSVDGGSNWGTIYTFATGATGGMYYTLDLGVYTNLRSSSGDSCYLLNF